MESPTVNFRSVNIRILSIIILALPILFARCTKDEDQVDEQKSTLFFEQAYPGISGDIVTYVINNDTITCNIINGTYIYQGDIILTEKQLSFSDTTKGAGLPLYVYRWPLSTVYYEIHKDLPDQSEVTDAIKEYENKTPLKFVKRTNQSNYIEFTPIESKEIAGYSSLGMVGGMQKIGLSKGANTGSVIHEIGHSLGLIHEQSRSDRDKYIKINYQNISPDFKSQFSKCFTQVISVQFDFSSIMLYSSKAFSINGKPTITKLDGSTYEAQRHNLSDLDVVTLNAMYKNFIYSNPSVNTLIPKNITMTNALIGCDVTSNGGIEITEKGVYWSTSMDPENNGTKFILPTTQSLGPITKLLTGLKPNTSYFIKAYAINSLGPGYGSQVSFKTLTIPTVLTSAISSSTITQTTAEVGGNVTESGGAAVTERGVYWGTSPNPESTGTKLQIGTGSGTFSTTLSGLTPSRTYYIRAYAINDAGSGYGSQVSFTTPSTINNPPTTPSSPNPSNGATGVSISPTLTWTCNDPDGDALTFDVYFGTSTNPTTTIVTNQAAFSIVRIGLSNNTTYYWKIVAKDSKGATTTGPVWSFTTSNSSGTIPTDGLVAYYPFNGNANDMSGNNNNGVLYGPTLAADRKGNSNRAYNFDGVNDYIEINNSSTLNLSQQISISLWTKLETSADYYWPYHIIEKYGSWGIGQREFDINSGIETSDSYFYLFLLNFEANKFYHIVMTYNGSLLSSYVNGILIESKSASGSIITNLNKIYIGKYTLGDGYFFDGTLDDIRIYNRALTQQEISALYNE